MKKLFYLFNFLLAITGSACSAGKIGQKSASDTVNYHVRQTGRDTLIARLLASYPGYFDSILARNSQYKVSIIYTQIDRSASNIPKFTHHYYNIDGAPYHYPASTVKLPIAALALQKLNELKITGLDRNATFISEAAFEKQTPVYNEPTSEDGRPTIAQYIKKILLVSDNDAYNRLYEFLGQEYINKTLHSMGWDSVQVVHRLSLPMNEEQNRHTNPVTFTDKNGKFLYKQDGLKSNLPYQKRNTFLGKGYMSNNELIEKPFDFSAKNRLALTDLHSMLQTLLFPQGMNKMRRFNLTQADHAFLQEHMSMMPSESNLPYYDSTYSDGYVKFLMYGGDGQMNNPSIRIFNKPGDAYGFLTDAAYIVDFDKGLEFMLTATICCNNDEVFNDDTYDYDTIGFPFLKNLGQVFYDYETLRPKKQKPDLSSFKYNYGK